MHRKRGFTLVELVLVIVLLGILSVYVLPRWLGTQGEESRNGTDELVARLRLVQLTNMNEQSNRCSWLRVEPGRFGHITTANCSAPGPIAGWGDAATQRGRVVALIPPVQLSGRTTFLVRFDRLGRPLADCQGGCSLSIGSEALMRIIKIEPEGYVHALP